MWSKQRRLIGLAVGAFLVLWLDGSVRRSSANTTVKRLEVGISAPDLAVIKRLENQLNFRFRSIQWYMDWEPFATELARRIREHGAIPTVAWQPQIGTKGIIFREVTQGKHDRYLDDVIASVRSLPFAIRISLAPEMNGDWEPWYVGRPEQGPNGAEGFKAFWRYVVTRFRNQGATNVEWIWAPNMLPDPNPYPYARIYPGDRWVTYLGFDGYNWGTTKSWSRWQSFQEVFGPSYRALTSLSHKPILITETGSVEQGGDKAAWITDMFQQLATEYPRVQGFYWHHFNKAHVNDADWAIDTSPHALAAFRNELRELPLRRN